MVSISRRRFVLGAAHTRIDVDRHIWRASFPAGDAKHADGMTTTAARWVAQNGDPPHSRADRASPCAIGSQRACPVGCPEPGRTVVCTERRAQV